jgi:peptide-methionine (S)-S-oxide reductase
MGVCFFLVLSCASVSLVWPVCFYCCFAVYLAFLWWNFCVVSRLVGKPFKCSQSLFFPPCLVASRTYSCFSFLLGIWRFPKGIYSTAVGYCAGFTPNPTYEEACSGMTGHTEGVRVVYDPKQVSYVDIIRWFWEAHDPTSGMGQGNDRGTQYRSGLYYFNDEQEQLAKASKAAYEKKLLEVTGREITTEIAAASNYDKYGGLWYFAEPYHQQYLAKPGSRPYCSAQPQGISVPDYEEWCPFPEGSAAREKYRPTLPASFWGKYAPKRGCSVVSEPNEPILASTF